MPTADVRDGRILLTNVTYRDKDLIDQVPGGSFSKNGGDHWTAPLTWPVLKVLRALFEDRLAVAPALAEWAWRHYESYVVNVAMARERAVDPSNDCAILKDDRPLQALYPYQKTGAYYLTWAKDALLLDEPGCGKTAQVIAALEMRSAYPALVVATTAGKSVWRDQFATWAPHRDVAVVTGSAAQRRKTLAEAHEVYVIGWGSLRLHTRVSGYGDIRLTPEERKPLELNAIEWGAVVADEAHRAIHPRSKQTRALWGVAKGVRPTGARIALTGTPIADNPADLWALLHFVRPDEWPSRTKYIDRYVEVSIDGFGHPSYVGLLPRMAEEFRALVEPRFLRRPKKVVLPWLPDKSFETVEVEMPPKQGAAYRAMVKEMIADVDGGMLMALDPLSLATRLTQLASSCVEVEGDEVRMVMPSSKVEALMELLEDREGPIVAAAQSRQLIDLTAAALERAGITFATVVGGMKDRERDREVGAFMAGERRVMLLTYGAGSESITLTRADTLVRMQRSWSLIENNQVIDRIHRPGQDSNKCLIIDLVSPGTIEEGQLHSVEGKGDRLEEIVRDRRALRRALTGETD